MKRGVIVSDLADTGAVKNAIYLGKEHPRDQRWRHEVDIAGKNLQGQTLIVGDSLSFVGALRAAEPSRALATIRAVRTAERVVLVSKRLVGDDETDASFLVNLCEPADVLPYRRSSLERDYSRINYFHAAFRGWLMPFNHWALYRILNEVFRGQIPGIRSTAALQANLLRLISAMDRQSVPEVGTAPPVKQAERSLIDRIADASRPVTNLVAGDEHEKMARALSEWVERVQKMPDSGDPYEREIKRAVAGLVGFAAARERQMRWGMILFAYMVLMLLYRFLVPNPKIRSISAREIMAGRASLVRRPFVPAWKLRNVSIPYTQTQMEIWILWTYGRLEEKDLVRLGLFADIEEAFLAGDRAYDPKVYERSGLCIGNLGEDAPKFDTLLKDLKGRRESVVVHTRFGAQGRDLLVPLLEKRKNVRVICAEDGNVDDVSCDTLILFEPLPKRERDILADTSGATDVVQYCCSVKHPKIWILSALFVLKKWLEFYPETFYTARFSHFSQSETPDELVLERQKELDDFEGELLSAG